MKNNQALKLLSISTCCKIYVSNIFKNQSKIGKLCSAKPEFPAYHLNNMLWQWTKLGVVTKIVAYVVYIGTYSKIICVRQSHLKVILRNSFAGLNFAGQVSVPAI